MNLGVRAHDFGKLPVEELAERISQKGFWSVQLAPAKAIAGLDAGLGRLSPGMAHYIRKAFERFGIKIAVLGCYINPVHPDMEERRRQLDRFKEHIRYARDFDCSVVATETGSLNADFSFHPENHGEKAFEVLLESVKELVGEAEKFGVLVGLEAVTKYVMHSPESVARVLQEVSSNNLQIVFDPVNLISMENFMNQEKVIKDSFDLFGDRIVTLHAKDFVVEGDAVKSVQAGQGLLDYTLLFKLLKEKKPYVDILMEDTKLDTMDEGIKYLKSSYEHS